MSLMKLGVPNDFFQTEITNTQAGGVSVTSITIASGVATVTQTAHGYSTGQIVTFSGVTGVTGLNGAHWQITSTGANTYTFPTSLTGTPAGTILAQPLYLFGAGQWFVALGANGLVEYNPDNTADAAQGVGITGATWRTLVPASSSGWFTTDGYAVRWRATTTTANSYFSLLT